MQSMSDQLANPHMAADKNCLPDTFAKQTYLVTSQTFIQNVCMLAGGLCHIA